MTRMTVKRIRVPEWCNESDRKVIEDFNAQDKKLCLNVYETLDLVQALEEGMYEFVYPECEEAERLKDLVDHSARRVRYLSFEVTDLYYKSHPTKRGTNDKENPKWHLLTIDEGSGAKDLRIGNYHILHNPDNHCTPYCAAYMYNKNTNGWGHGHYFISLTGALEYAVFNSSDGDE